MKKKEKHRRKSGERRQGGNRRYLFKDDKIRIAFYGCAFGPCSEDTVVGSDHALSLL